MKIAKSVTMFALAFSLLSVGGCTDNFEKWNTNPDQATEEMMTKDNLLTGSFFVQMQKNVMPIAGGGTGDDAYQICVNLLGDAYSGYMGSLLTKRGTPTYDMIAEWRDVPFERGYVGVMTPWKRIKEKSASTDPIGFAMATIVKVAGMHRVTDMYGPIPYSNFGKSSAYDSQKDVYYAFFDELNSAIEVLTEYVTKNPSGKYLTDYDNIYNGEVKNWVKLANTLRLRLAVRLAYADEAKAQQEAKIAISNPIGLITNKTDMAAFRHDKTGSGHSLYIIYTQFDDTRMGAVIESYMNGFADPRLDSYFTPTSNGTFLGVRSGITISRKDDYTVKGKFSGLNISQKSPVVWVNPAESFFLLAEIALRGWNVGVTQSANELYEEGIKASFDYCGKSDQLAAYLNSVTTPTPYEDPVSSVNNYKANLPTINVKWNDSDNFEKKLERIITQKWIAIFPDGQEAWSEFRRTGYPKVFPVVINNSNGTINTATQIRRIPFSSKEVLNNSQEVAKGVTLLQGPDNGNTKLWWDKK